MKKLPDNALYPEERSLSKALILSLCRAERVSFWWGLRIDTRVLLRMIERGSSVRLLVSLVGGGALMCGNDMVSEAGIQRNFDFLFARSNLSELLV